MGHFLVFLSRSDLQRQMVEAWTIFWSFCHREVSRSEWQWDGPFSDLSVTVRSTVEDGGGMD